MTFYLEDGDVSSTTGSEGGGAVERAEAGLGDPSPAARRQAVAALAKARAEGAVRGDAPGGWVNLHCHTFFSYNPNGWTPSQFAWLAVRRGLRAAGIVDFDVLDGVDEFLESADTLGIRAAAGMECRVFVPEFATREINSPGEPGISYHMGIGFASSSVAPALAPFLGRLREISTRRNRAMIAKVNAYLAPAGLDYEQDVLPLTPRGNATERHICLAYARKARARFADDAALARFWSEKLGVDAAKLDLPDGPKLQGEIRGRLMKRGGVGYVAPDQGSFPTMEEMNRFVLGAGAIPTIAWLDGTTEGEQAMDELMDLGAASGVAALNIIPDRNYTPGKDDAKLRNLREVIAKATARNWPVFVGTEMNSPGNKFVDAFETAELSPFVPVFLRGARIAWAHTALQSAAGMGYGSGWARRHMPGAAERNAFFEAAGARIDPRAGCPPAAADPSNPPDRVLARL